MSPIVIASSSLCSPCGQAWIFLLTSLGCYSFALVRFRIAYAFHICADIFAANNLDTIPAPLLDRMEVIEVSGYVSEEKSMIAEKYLGPQAREASGLKNADVILDPTSVDVLIKYYCRESGVRNLKKHIEKVSGRRTIPVDGRMD